MPSRFALLQLRGIRIASRRRRQVGIQGHCVLDTVWGSCRSSPPLHRRSSIVPDGLLTAQPTLRTHTTRYASTVQLGTNESTEMERPSRQPEDKPVLVCNQAIFIGGEPSPANHGIPDMEKNHKRHSPRRGRCGWLESGCRRGVGPELTS